jgi:hypothetical protein
MICALASLASLEIVRTMINPPDRQWLATRYALLLDHLRRKLTTSVSWMGVPALLDELHVLRCQFDSLEPAGVSEDLVAARRSRSGSRTR